MPIIRLFVTKVCLVSMMTAFAGSAIAAPFGVAMGTKVSDLKVQKDLGEGLFAVLPPTTNPNLVRYYVYATPKHGVCNVSAGSKSSFDSVLARSLLDDLRKLLTVKYGSAKPEVDKFDVAWFDKVVGKPDFDEQASHWSGNLPDDIRRITLKLSKSSEGFSVHIKYAFDNESSCYLWSPENEATGL